MATIAEKFCPKCNARTASTKGLGNCKQHVGTCGHNWVSGKYDPNKRSEAVQKMVAEQS